MKTRVQKAWLAIAVGAVALAAGVSPSWAHGERAQEPFLRMRSIQWFDINWSTDRLNVNDEMTVSGKFRVFEDWPKALTTPEVSFINVNTPGPVFHRMLTEIGGEPQFFSGPLEMGRDYDFKVVIKGRKPGDYHVHVLVNMKTNGPVAGPGSWVKVEGDQANYSTKIKTLTGKTYEAETVGLANGVAWHLIWGALAAAWLLYWLARPIFLARYRALQAGREDVLTTPTDIRVGAITLVVSLGLIGAGYLIANLQHPNVIPLQAGEARYKPMPEQPKTIDARVLSADYDVPGRSMRVNVEVTNTGQQPVRLAEFSTAGVRFRNPAGSGVPLENPAYPQDMLAAEGLVLDDNQAIAPGETKKLKLTMTDVIWETQRLADLVNDPDSRFGGLLMFFDAENNRQIVSISGPVIPIFRRA
jgi:methane/ammonia monooxygenase subunit B